MVGNNCLDSPRIGGTVCEKKNEPLFYLPAGSFNKSMNSIVLA